MCDCIKHRKRFAKCTCVCPEHKNFDLAFKLAVERHALLLRQEAQIEELHRRATLNETVVWDVTLGHPDKCPRCLDLMEKAIGHARRAGTESRQMVFAEDGHMGSARRSE